MKQMKCGHCGFDKCEYGVTVCQGCGAEILYSATCCELIGGLVGGYFLGAIATGVIAFGLGVPENDPATEIIMAA